MTREEIMKELKALSNRIFSLEQKVSEYAEMLNDKTTADLDYISMETGIDLDQEEEVIE